ncbi:hypothetical protein OSH93_12875, partial [Mycobacterium ulcerans]|nr:hypothetical protein [Mycobacterium ulcerans]MEB3978257.1 hypothetical protein [Mycobacterium ulcerans]MEB4007555.1 hypothetical protein [Mycobacterium ulcerans]MEB4417136.1 hypothetical protein [Mycobacterium ulcerans]MEB4435284.1 hypothetical protein [Mycobacterium ulcerans]
QPPPRPPQPTIPQLTSLLINNAGALGIAPADRRASGRAVSAQTTVGRCVTMSNMAEGASARAKSGEDAAELRKESYTMALYVAVCLLAALLALPEAARHHLIGLIWGITIGLAAAHFFAFKISARLIGPAKSRLATSRRPAHNWSAPPWSPPWRRSPSSCCQLIWITTPPSSACPGSSRSAATR